MPQPQSVGTRLYSCQLQSYRLSLSLSAPRSHFRFLPSTTKFSSLLPIKPCFTYALYIPIKFYSLQTQRFLPHPSLWRQIVWKFAIMSSLFPSLALFPFQILSFLDLTSAHIIHILKHKTNKITDIWNNIFIFSFKRMSWYWFPHVIKTSGSVCLIEPFRFHEPSFQ